METQARNESGFIGRVIAGSVRNKALTLLLAGALAVWGWYAMTHGPLDAIPDLSDVQVIILTEWPGQSPDIVEDQITYPISTALLAAPPKNRKKRWPKEAQMERWFPRSCGEHTR